VLTGRSHCSKKSKKLEKNILKNIHLTFLKVVIFLKMEQTQLQANITMRKSLPLFETTNRMKQSQVVFA